MSDIILSLDIYDTILDALDSEHSTLLYNLFIKYNLTYNSKLFDAPRQGFNDKLLYTYMDYVLSYNLSNILDFLIDTIHVEIDDTLIARCLELENIETYNYILLLGYVPQIKTFREAVHNCYSSIIESILTSDIELITELTEDDIANIFNYNIDSDTVESLYILFNYGVNPTLFTRYLYAFKHPEHNNIIINEDENEYVLEIINILECNCNSE